MDEFLSTYTIDSRPVSFQPRGLVNRNNYCYLNAILQALIACPPFYNMLNCLSENIPSNVRRKSIPFIVGMCRFVRQFDCSPSKIRRQDRGVGKLSVIIKTCTPFSPRCIHKLLHSMRTDWIEGRQQDAEEFLSFLLNGLKDEMMELFKCCSEEGNPPVDSATGDNSSDEWKLQGSKNSGYVYRRTNFASTPVSDIFEGKLKSSIHRAGGHITENIQPFLTLPLNVGTVQSVRGALDLFISKNRLECNGQVEAWEQVALHEPPVVLILHLQFFDFSHGGCTKIVKDLDYEFDLNIDSILDSSKSHSPEEKQYKLFAVVYHDGDEADMGHYVTDAFHVGYNCWLRYNDSSVKTVQDEYVLKPQGTRVPYLLFYRRSDMM
ncbi:ubiquitin carboxyl-terminal hydrolase 10-like [Leptinotarsa decemlineata]|uniref:ubiquitin carboxyl-terminal hydrolase 10-like n=1 Tax=Leptinotarsa decemlineata TaxID=7539 RepID=UPI003D30C28D